MSEEEIIKTVDNFLDGYRQYNVKTGETYIPYKYGEGQKFCYVEDFEAIQGLLDLYNKEKEKREMEEENHKVLCLDLGQALKDLGLPEDTIISDELVLEINKKYISKDKFKEKIDFLKEVLAFAETGRDEKATIQANLLKNIIIEMEKLLED